MIRRLAIAALFALAPAAHAELPENVSRMLAAAGIPQDALGVLVLRGDSTLLAHGADRVMMPGSTMKLVTTVVGLEKLGPAFKGRTELRASGEVVKGTLHGDLVLRGGADADFSGEALERMLRALRNQGVARIKGGLVLDRELFQPPRPDLGAPPFDEAPEFRYNVIPDALLLNLNLHELDLRADGKRLTVALAPALDKVSVSADMTLVDDDCAKWEAGWKVPEYVRERDGRIRIVLRGTFPRNCAQSFSVNVLDRQDYVDRMVRTTWRKLGGTLLGATRTGPAPADTRLVAEHVARALPELIRDTNKTSDNTYARTIFLSLGSLDPDPVTGSRPIAWAAPDTTFGHADMAVRQWMREQGIDDGGMVLENGSGLSRVERISPRQMGGLLKVALGSNWAPEFQASLPIAAVDGTMRRRLKDSPAAARARLKTGMLKDVVALAGYVPDARGEHCVLVAFINHDPLDKAKGRAILDALADWAARTH